jgi:hypothetical protein
MHRAGGPGPQDTADRLLDKLIDWVEEPVSRWTVSPELAVDRTLRAAR